MKLRSSGYRPQTQGVCESWHKVLNSMLAMVIHDNQRDWSKWIDYVVYCYNTTSHSSTGFAPYFVMTGRVPRWNIDFLLNSADLSQSTLPDYTVSLLQRLDKAFRMVRESLNRTADNASTWYNKKVHCQSFSEGDHVRVYNPRRFKGRSPKWQSFYKDVGIIDKKLNDVLYVVNCITWRRPKVVHVDKLKRVVKFCA